jgi:acyl-CoA synthetase (AMP-forming)/AMP-acid ligase II
MSWIRDRIRSFGDAPAISARGRLVTYRELDAAIEAWVTMLRAAALPPGATVAIVGDFSPGVTALFIAAHERRLIIAPLPRVPGAQIQDALEATRAGALADFTGADAPPIVRLPKVAPSPLVERLRAKGSAGLVILSSGSTGKPKASLLDLSLLLDKFIQAHSPVRALSFLMLDHIGGVNTLFTILCCGGLMVCPPQRDPETVCNLIQTHRVQLLPVTPTFLKMLLISGAHHWFDLSSLKVISFGTEPMPPSTLHALKGALPHVSFRQLYGLTELGILPARSDPRDPLWIQFDDRAVDTKVIDGTLWVRSPSAMLGYLNADQPFDGDGWFNTHDAVEIDGDRLRVLGRASELINVGGEKVYPTAVEDVLLQMPGVRDACVFAKPNPVTGQVVAARVWLGEDCDPARFRESLREFCCARLAPYQMPMAIEISHGPLHGARFKKIRTAVAPASAPQ